MNTLNETIAVFGPDHSLTGILAQPGAGASGRIGCLLLNTGVNHRIGPHRLNVKLARRLASLGIPSLRFDLSGIGDSRPAQGAADFRHQALLDMKAALDHFETVGVRQVMVFGICSGAENGLALALNDSRVVGLTQFDGDIFRTRAVLLRRKLRRLMAVPFNESVRRNTAWWLTLREWLAAPTDRAALHKLLGHVSRRFVPGNEAEPGIFEADGQALSAADFEANMNTLLARKVAIYLMYSAGLQSADRGRDLLSSLHGAPFLQGIRYRFWPDIDHTATTLGAQKKLLDEVCGWAVDVAAQRTETGPVSAESGPSRSTRPRAPARQSHFATL